MTDVTSLIRSHINRAAAKADRKPTAGQKEAGNYRKGKIRFHGLDISIENPRGSMRSGVDKGGKPWSVRLPDHYGYFNRTEGSDGDHVDCYIGRHPLSSRVFVIDQVDADSGDHDEHKVMLGYTSREEALSAYRRAFSDGRGDDRIGSVEEMDIDQFKRWLRKEGGLPRYAEGGAVNDDYNTRLGPADEMAYRAWKMLHAPKDSGVDYDLRGAYASDMQRDPASGHMGDRFKKPNHPTFSDQSQYAVGDQRDRAGFWIGPEGPDQTFVPPAAMRASGGGVGYADGGAPDLPDAPWATAAAAPKADASLPDAPWSSQPSAAPAERTWGDTARSAWDVASPVLQAAGRAIPGPVGAAAAGARNLDPAAVGETISNIPKSAAQFGSDLVQPILHPIDTAESFKNLGLGVLEKTGALSGTEHEKYADAVGHFLADRYGGIENVKKTMREDPVGLAGDLSMFLTGGGSAAARAPGMVGRVGEAARAAGSAIDPLQAVSAAGRGAGHVAAEALGVTTGAGGEAFRVAQRAGLEGGKAAESFRENLTGAAPLEAAVDEARGAVAQIRKERGDAYREGMAKVGADDTPLDFGKIDKAVWDSQKVKTYKGQVLSPKTEGIRQEMTDAVGNWRDLDPSEFHTPEGIDALKQKLGDIRDATQPHTPERVAADQIYNAVRKTIVDQVPEYAKVMKGYEQASKQIKEIETTLSLKPGANVDTALRKLQSTLRDNVNTSFGRRGELAKFLTTAGAPHLMEKLAGQALSAWVPRGLARLATLESVPAIAGAVGHGAVGAAAGALAALPTMSPRLMGEAAYGVGRARRAAQPLAPVPRITRQVGELSRATEPFGDMGENPYRP